MKKTEIRHAREDDVATILQFIRELAEYENALSEVIATEENLRSSLFGADATAFALIAQQDDKPVGFAVYFFSYSTWLGTRGLFLDDLYVSPDSRGRGIGRMLLQHLARRAVSHGCGRFEWNVLSWNRPAVEFYLSLGAKPQSEWISYRLDGKPLRDLAGHGSDQ